MGEQIEADHFRIVDFSIDETSGTPAHFVRSPAHHVEALQRFYQQTGSDFARFNYLGEWHSHPSFPVLPSREDRVSMQRLVEGERDIDFSALLIVRLRYRFVLEAGAYMFARGAEPRDVALTA